MRTTQIHSKTVTQQTIKTDKYHVA